MYRNFRCVVTQVENEISFYRNKYGFTQSYIAELLGVSVNTVSSWETLEYAPSLSHALALASLFRVPVEELFWTVTYLHHSSDCLDCEHFSDAGCLLEDAHFKYVGPWSIPKEFFNE